MTTVQRATCDVQRMGFTLVEVTVALVLAAFVLLAAHKMVSVVLDSTARLARSERELTRAANARRVLTSVMGSVQAGAVSGDGFTGDSTQVQCSTWYQDRLGLPARYRVTLAARGGALVLDGLPDGSLILADSVARLDLDYLLGLGASSGWVRGWSSPVSAPLAVRLRLRHAGAPAADTVLLLIGERG